ncbi:MAG: hypothetical protein SFW66_09045 [Gammaproteobacteria bacterium]|nr:hypothetical protein [Gammaproteobacteria bacterium]
MIESEFQPVMKELSDFYNKTLSPTQHEIWFRKMRNLSKWVFSEVVSEVIGFERYFPTPAKVLELAAKHREIVADKEKQSYPSITQVSRASPRDSEYVRDAKEVFRLVCLEGLTGEPLADTLKAMADKYPGKGWEA